MESRHQMNRRSYNLPFTDRLLLLPGLHNRLLGKRDGIIHKKLGPLYQKPIVTEQSIIQKSGKSKDG